METQENKWNEYNIIGVKFNSYRNAESYYVVINDSNKTIRYPDGGAGNNWSHKDIANKFNDGTWYPESNPISQTLNIDIWNLK